MFNPLYPFTTDVLQATIQKGCRWFVRNTYPQAGSHFDEEVKGCFLMSHFNDFAKATTHYNSTAHDPHRFLYDSSKEEHKIKLLTAAGQPAGYKIYSAYFLPDYKKKIGTDTKDKINRYVYLHTNWKPSRGETMHIDFYLQFAAIFITLGYAGQQLKIKFEDIENLP